MQTVPESIRNASNTVFYLFRGGEGGREGYSKMLEYIREKKVYENH